MAALIAQWLNNKIYVNALKNDVLPTNIHLFTAQDLIPYQYLIQDYKTKQKTDSNHSEY